MNKCVLILLIAFCSLTVKAQQRPYYTQYILNNYILNPALSGIESYTDVKLSYRNQWTGIDGAPVTTYLSIHAPVGANKDDIRETATSFDKGGVNVRGPRYWEDYTAPASHSGVGLIVMNDKTGYLNRFSAQASYAYHKPLGVKTTLSVGFSAGITSMSIDASKVVFGPPTQDPFDPALMVVNGNISKLQPEIGGGLWLYSSDYFIGASVLNIVPGKIKFTSDATSGTYYVPHFFLNAGYRFFLNDDISILPSVALQVVRPAPPQINANVKLQYLDKFWIGGSYRPGDELGGYAAMAGFNISSTFNVGYAYDVATNSALRTYSKNSHEILIGFLLNNKWGDTCPRNVW